MWDTTPARPTSTRPSNITYTHVFTPNLVFHYQADLQPPEQPAAAGRDPVSPTLYSTSSVPSLPGTGTQLIFPGYNEYTPGNAIPFGGPQNLYQIYEDLSWTKGRHQFNFGGSYIQIRDNRVFGAYENPMEPLVPLSRALATITRQP